jgi:hypothetical protein
MSPPAPVFISKLEWNSSPDHAPLGPLLHVGRQQVRRPGSRTQAGLSSTRAFAVWLDGSPQDWRFSKPASEELLQVAVPLVIFGTGFMPPPSGRSETWPTPGTIGGRVSFGLPSIDAFNDAKPLSAVQTVDSKKRNRHEPNGSLGGLG